MGIEKLDDQAAEQAATGADLRVTIPVGTSVDEGTPAASSSVLDAVEGVDTAFAVLSTTASVGPDPIPFVDELAFGWLRPASSGSGR